MIKAKSKSFIGLALGCTERFRPSALEEPELSLHPEVMYAAVDQGS